MNLLVVKADPRIATLLRRGFGADGHSVEIAPDLDAARAVLADAKFDAIVVDCGGDVADAIASCTALRSANDWTPLLVLLDQADDGTAVLDAGADDTIAKPFSLVTVETRLRSVLRDPQDARRRLVVDDLELDVARRRCERAGAAIALTPTEFNILELLMRRSGDPVSKADILAHTWDYEYRGNPNIVEVYVSTLRRKIDLPFQRRNLCTVWGIGYEMRGSVVSAADAADTGEGASDDASQLASSSR